MNAFPAEHAVLGGLSGQLSARAAVFRNRKGDCRRAAGHLRHRVLRLSTGHARQAGGALRRCADLHRKCAAGICGAALGRSGPPAASRCSGEPRPPAGRQTSRQEGPFLQISAERWREPKNPDNGRSSSRVQNAMVRCGTANRSPETSSETRRFQPRFLPCCLLGPLDYLGFRFPSHGPYVFESGNRHSAPARLAAKAASNTYVFVASNNGAS